MALRVGELYASMRLDNSAFDKGLDESGRRFGKLQSVITSGVKTGAKLFAGLVTGATALGVAAVKVGIEYNGMRQMAQAALTTVTGSAEEAAAQMERLDSFGRDSWVMRDKLIEAQKLMTGFGIETEKVIPYLDGLQKGVAAAGGNNQTFIELAEIMAQIKGQSKITAEELRRFGIRGIDAAAMIGEAMGKTGAEIREEITAGTLDADEALDALAAGMAKKFPDAVENVRATWQGAVDNMSAAWRDFGAELARPLVDPQGGGLLVGWVNQLADAFWDAADKARPLVDLLVQRFAPGIASVSPAIEQMQAAINAWDISKVNSQLDSLSKYTPLIAGTSAALFALGTTNLPILSQLGFTGINPVVAGLAALVATSPAAREALSGVFSAAGPLAETAKELGITLSDTLLHALDTLVPAAGALAVAFVEAGVPLVQSLTPALVSLMTAAVPLVDVVASIAQWVSELPTPILAAGLAFVALMGPLKPVAEGLANVATGFIRIIQQAQVQAALGNTNVAMGGLARASAVAGPAVRGVGTALKTAFISSGIGIGIAAIAAAIAAFATKSAEARARTEEYRAAISGLGDEALAAAEKVMAANLVAEDSFGWTERLDLKSKLGEEIGSVADALEVLGFKLGDVTEAASSSDAVWEAYKEQMLGSVEVNSDLWQALNLVIQKIEEERDSLEGARHAEEQMADATRDGANATDEATGSVQRHIDALRDQHDALLEGADASIGQSKALRRQEEAQDRTREALKKLTDVTNDSEASEKDLEKARRAVEAALDDEAASNIDLLGAMDRNNASTGALRAATQRARDSFIENARQMGLTKREAEKLADSYGLIPEKINTTVTLETAQAKWQLDEFIRTQSGRTIHIRTTTSGVSYGVGRGSGQLGGPQRYEADGGITVPSYADGKMPHHAIIQSAKPGLVQWAEPETQGEAFIPLAPSKRARSLQIWEETGRRLGAFAAKSFADGGFNSPTRVSTAASGGQVPVHVSVVLSDSQFARLESSVARGVSGGFSGEASRQVLLSRGGG